MNGMLRNVKPRAGGSLRWPGVYPWAFHGWHGKREIVSDLLNTTRLWDAHTWLWNHLPITNKCIDRYQSAHACVLLNYQSLYPGQPQAIRWYFEWPVHGIQWLYDFNEALSMIWARFGVCWQFWVRCALVSWYFNQQHRVCCFNK